MNEFGKNFLPGPTDVRPEIFAAMGQPMMSHRGPRMQQLLAAVQAPLQQCFGTTQPVFVATSSATGLLEAAVRNGVRQRVLVACGGYFGEYLARIAEMCGRQAIRVNVHPGAAITPEQLDQFLEGPEVDAVAVVHSESSTGALADIPALAQVVRRRKDVMLLVDGVTAVGAMPIEMDRWGVDFYCTGSQKALALPPGLAFGAASERLIARSEQQDDAGFYFSLKKLVTIARENLPFWTPALPQFFALERQLADITREGWPARFARHQRMQEVVEEWIAGHPRLRLMAAPGKRSRAISAVVLPEDIPAAGIIRQLGERGFLVGSALLSGQESVFRIGHMGDLQPHHLEALLAEVERLLG